MASVALIGPDGSGKTTLTRMLLQSRMLPFKYLYMGVAASSSNVVLPTTTLAERIKRRAERQARHAAVRGRHVPRPRRRPIVQLLWATARFVNRVAEEWFRQLLSWHYQRRGWVMLFDRHFVFDFAPELMAGTRQPFDSRLHGWLLAKTYPRPDLVIFLDAPGELLFARKGELTAAELERRRRAFLDAGRRHDHFVRVDATRPLPEVYADVADHIRRFCTRHD